MSQQHICPECGTEWSGESTEGVCPKCLLKAGLEQSTLASDSVTARPTIVAVPSLDAEDPILGSEGNVAGTSSVIGTKGRSFGDYEYTSG